MTIAFIDGNDSEAQLWLQDMMLSSRQCISSAMHRPNILAWTFATVSSAWRFCQAEETVSWVGTTIEPFWHQACMTCNRCEDALDCSHRQRHMLTYSASKTGKWVLPLLKLLGAHQFQQLHPPFACFFNFSRALLPSALMTSCWLTAWVTLPIARASESMKDAHNENNGYVARLACLTNIYMVTFVQVGANHGCMNLNTAVKL